MDLFLSEHKKLWRKTTTRAVAVLCFVYVVVFGSILSFQWFSFGSRNDYTSAFGNNFDGFSMIRDRQEYSRAFSGEFTDETLQELVRDYQRMKAAGMDKELEKTEWQVINGWLGTLWPELNDNENNKFMLSYVDPSSLTGFYERRQQVLEDFLEINGQTGEEKEYILRMARNVQKPFLYEWTGGWSMIVGSVASDLNLVMALFLSIVLSSLFAGEWHSNTSALVLTTRNGWEKIALAKILTGICFTLELFAMLTAGNVISQIFFLGTSGWDMPIQNVKLIAVAPMNMLQAEIYEYAFTLLGAVGFAEVVMLLSAATKSTVLALLFSLAVVYGPMVIARYLPFGLQKALDLIPLVGSGTDIFRTNTFRVFGKIIWSPYLLISVPVLIGMCCIPFVVRKWARRMKI